MDSKNLISVVIPTYNSEKFILKTLESVSNQSLLPDQIVVSDDGSSDNTVIIVKEFFDKVSNIETVLVENDHKGAGAARNSGISASKYQWISFLDSDDIWRRDKLKVVKKIIDENPKSNFIFHDEEKINLNGEKTILLDFAKYFDQDETLIKQLWRYCIFHTSAITVKRNLLIQKKMFNERLLSSQDWDLWIRLAEDLKYVHIPQVLGIYIDREQNITNTKSFNGLIDRLKVMTIHWKKSKASIWDYLYMVFRRIIAFIFDQIKVIIR